MKRLIFFVCFASFFVTVYSQDKVSDAQPIPKNEIGIFSNVGICELSGPQAHTFISAAHGKAVFSYGLNYMRTISPKLKMETGIFYSKYTIVDHIIDAPDFDFYATEYFKIISIPILLRYYFPKEFYISGGTILDLVFARPGGWNLSDSQNGFGLSIGAGKEISINKFSISIGTNFDLHAAIPFSGDLSQQKFFVPGLKIGLNYKI
jgi:hypothetical protein